jgi:hypothetical protein
MSTVTMIVVAVHSLEEAPHMFAQPIIQDLEGLAAATAMGLRLLDHEVDPPATHLVHPPGGLRENAGQIRFVNALKDGAVHMNQALIGQHDQPSQIVLEIVKLVLVVKQLANDYRVLRDDGSWGDNRQFHHPPLA